jgi:hypothetical protein
MGVSEFLVLPTGFLTFHFVFVISAR